MSAALLEAPKTETPIAPVPTWTGAKQESATHQLFHSIGRRIVASDEWKALLSMKLDDAILAKLLELARGAFLEELAARRWRLWTNLFVCHSCHQKVETEAREGREYLETVVASRAAAMMEHNKEAQKEFLADCERLGIQVERK